MKREKPDRKSVPRHEAIKKRQRGLALPYANCKPSEVTDFPWIYARRKTGSYPPATPQGGKWLIFVPFAQVDGVWATIKTATEEGKLGEGAKVATAKQNPRAKDASAKVICVYTYDWTDEDDVRRIRQELRALGITQKIPYKADQDTFDGKYQVTGHTRISKYYE